VEEMLKPLNKMLILDFIQNLSNAVWTK
jgi:hypothetical protein